MRTGITGRTYEHRLELGWNIVCSVGDVKISYNQYELMVRKVEVIYIPPSRFDFFSPA
jgi:hypothetical protein